MSKDLETWTPPQPTPSLRSWIESNQSTSSGCVTTWPDTQFDPLPEGVTGKIAVKNHRKPRIGSGTVHLEEATSEGWIFLELQEVGKWEIPTTPQGRLDERPKGKESSHQRSGLVGLPEKRTENTWGRGSLDNRRQLSQISHKSREALENRCLEVLRCSNASNVGFTGNSRSEEDTHRHHDDG